MRSFANVVWKMAAILSRPQCVNEKGFAVTHIDGSVQDCSIPSALANEILQSCTKPSTYSFFKMPHSLWCVRVRVRMWARMWVWVSNTYLNTAYNGTSYLYCTVKRLSNGFVGNRTSLKCRYLIFTAHCHLWEWAWQLTHIYMSVGKAVHVLKRPINTLIYHPRWRGVNVFTLHVCVCWCVRLFVMFVCPNDLTMKDSCHTNTILQVTWHRSQSKSNFKIAISPAILKAQNIGNAILLAYSLR